MKLRKLEVQGFKSFADKTTLVFEDGITGVVGPNGCGKSNITDSIRWVMGEQRAKALRGSSMEDIIFNGSDSRRPLGMSEVRATFQVNPGDLPRPFSELSEITIGRRIFRGGDADYFINKTSCRLRDITDLFLGTGAGKGSYSVIEQGRVAAMVTARPEERRGYLEEAAGITRYQRRREEAQRKIEATKQNLSRVGDLVGELEKRLASLQRQAEKAERFKKLREEQRRLELHFAAAKELELLAQMQFYRREVERLGEALAAATARVSALEAASAERRETAEESARVLAQREQEVYAAENRVKLAEAELHHALREREELARRMQEAERELVLSKESLLALEQERAGLENEQQQARALGESADVEVARCEEALRSAASRAMGLEARLKELREEESEASRERATALARLEGLIRQRSELEERMDRLSDERDREQEAADALFQQVKACEARLSRDRERQRDLAGQREQSEIALLNARSQRQESLGFVEGARAELTSAQARLGSLESIANRYEGFSRGVREVMGRHKDPRAAGLLGVVADLIDCPPQLQGALAAALGDRLEAIVIDEPERAIEESEFLAQGKGRVLFLPLEASEHTARRVAALPSEAVADLASVANAGSGSHKEAQRAIASLLDGALAVADLPSALRAWRAGWEEGPLCTLKGEVIEPEGLLRVGKGGADAQAEMLARRREIRELSARVAQLREELKAREARAHEAARTVEVREQERDKARRDEEELSLALKSVESDKKRAEGEALRLAGRARQLAEERAKGISKLAELEGQHAELESTRDEEALREEAARLALSRALRESGEERAKASRAQEALSDAKVKAAQAKERALSAAQALARQERTRQDLSARAARAQASLDASRERMNTLEQSRARQSDDVEGLRAAFSAVQERLSAARSASETARLLLAESEALLGRARRDEGQLSSQVSTAESKLHETETARQLCHEALLSRFRLRPSEILLDYHLLAPPSKDDRARLELLGRDIDALGEVNLTAIDEYHTESERYRFLNGQKADLESALASLESAIAKLNRSSRELFQETFDAINKNFGMLFKRLFRGGNAHLALTDPDDPLEAGVEIYASPPGKRLQSVGLLSGGEKALTAVALTFGIFLLRPSPFCILDEVDAPLDEANVGRFADLIRELQGATQFVMVTHNQRAMEIADTLYGVTMEEPGVSKIVSVRLRDVRQPQAPRPA
jgi:chromosome segregation protein